VKTEYEVAEEKIPEKYSFSGRTRIQEFPVLLK